MSSTTAEEHRFVTHPHRTMAALSWPILLSLVAEPITGLVDTAFVKELGTVPAAALGIGVILLSAVAWVFNFLSIGTQTEVARASGAGELARARELCGTAMVLSLACGVALSVAVWAALEEITGLMTEDAQTHELAATYLGIRLLGSPWALVTLTAVGALRGLQDMRTPLLILAGAQGVNICLDPVLIFGFGPIPPMGIAGAAWASAVSQWLGALGAVLAVARRLGMPSRIRLSDATRLCIVGRDLFLRTGLLMTFLLLAQIVAGRAGNEEAAAHHAIRQVWMFTALVLDAYAAAAQSLVGYFRGANRIDLARRAAGEASWWGLGTGVLLAAGMIATTEQTAGLLVPDNARAAFAAAWIVAAVAQPLNALSFVTDGVHWGTSDYRYLRNAMIAATVAGVVGLVLLDRQASDALTNIWWVTGGWITIRAACGVIRIWPGVGSAPLARENGGA